MFIKLKPLIYSLIFLFGMEVFFLFNSWSFYVIAILLILAFFQGKKVGGKWIFSFIPSIFVIFSGALFYLVTLSLEKQIFILLSSSIYYLALLGASRLKESPTDKTAKGMLIAASFTSLFFALTSFYGFYLNFMIPVYGLMLTYFIVSFLVSYQTLYLFERSKKMTLSYSFILALVVAEISWALNFWPFGYLTTGVIALILYYVLWEIVRSHFLLILSKKRIVWQLATFCFVSAMVLITSKWIPAF